MGITIICYSLTGNNKLLAQAVAKELDADLKQVTESGSRKTGRIILDAVFGRSPKVSPDPQVLGKSSRILFIGPVWMGKAASPFRLYLKYIQKHPVPYAYASLSGGALNPNPGLEADLQKRTGAKPFALVDLHIADLLPQNPKPTMKDTSAYRLSVSEANRMAGIVAEGIKNAQAK